MKAVTCPVILTSASTRVDGSLGLRFSTPELKPEEKTVFFELLNINLEMTLHPSGQTAAELKEIKSRDTKTPSQRLRSVLYVLWKETDGTGDFEDFYRRRMNSIIDRIKEKFPERTT